MLDKILWLAVFISLGVLVVFLLGFIHALVFIAIQNHKIALSIVMSSFALLFDALVILAIREELK